MTEKLYEVNAYIKEFTATVIDCIKSKDFYKIVLDKTAFFPEGGGQAADVGALGEAEVFDAQIESDIIYHYTKEPIDDTKVNLIPVDLTEIDEETGKLAGDVDFDRVAPCVRAITPVPGGVGPMTIAMLMKNTLTAAKTYGK